MREHIKQEWHQYLMIMRVNPMVNFTNRAFSPDVTAAMLVFQSNPVELIFFSYVKAFFCSNKFE